MKKLMIMGLLAMPLNPLYADTTLPYIGPENAACGINQPQGSNEESSGYETSEDCGIIYVKPPVIGSFISRKPFVLQEAALCPMFDNLYEGISKLSEQKQGLDPIDDIEKMREVIVKTRELKDLVKRLSGREAVSHVSAAATLRWSQLVERYRELNPLREVRPLPITTGIYSSRIYAKDALGSLTDAGLPGVVAMNVNGINIEDGLEGIEDMPLPSLIEKLTTEPGTARVFMGESLGLSLTLDLAGTCAALKDDNAKGLLSGTYTYFYPLQTKAQFKVRVEEVVLEKIIYDVLRANAKSATADQVYAALQTTNAISVDINEGLFPGSEEGKRLATEHKAEITKLALDSILATISEKTEIILEEATRDILESRSSKSCKRTWYGKKKCHTVTYTVKVPKIDWVKVKKELAAAGLDGEASANTYRSLFMMGTSAILPGAE